MIYDYKSGYKRTGTDSQACVQIESFLTSCTGRFSALFNSAACCTSGNAASNHGSIAIKQGLTFCKVKYIFLYMRRIILREDACILSSQHLKTFPMVNDILFLHQTHCISRAPWIKYTYDVRLFEVYIIHRLTYCPFLSLTIYSIYPLQNPHDDIL